MYLISIKALSIITKIGIYEWEKIYEQKLLIDLKIKYIYKKIENNYLNYDEIVKAILIFSKNHQFSLLEQMLEKLSDLIISKFRVKWIKITLHKPNAIPHAKDTSITLERNLN